jgi:hypothetical protein
MKKTTLLTLFLGAFLYNAQIANRIFIPQATPQSTIAANIVFTDTLDNNKLYVARRSSFTLPYTQITGRTTLGGNLFSLTNPSAITFMRINADNSVSTLDASSFRTAIGAGSGTVTSIGLTTGTSGTDINVSGSPVTASGSITLNIPTSSTANRGLLSSADWTTFNSKQSAITGGASTITSSNLTASRALISNGSGKVDVSATTSTELSYLSGVTSSVQTQINNSFFGKTDITFAENRNVYGSNTYGFGFNALSLFNVSVNNGSFETTRMYADDATTEFYSSQGYTGIQLSDEPNISLNSNKVTINGLSPILRFSDQNDDVISITCTNSSNIDHSYLTWEGNGDNFYLISAKYPSPTPIVCGWDMNTKILTNTGAIISESRSVVTKLENTATLDFANTVAGTQADLTVTVTGAVVGDIVTLGVPNGSVASSNVSFFAWVSASNTVTVRFNNNNLLTAVNPASGTFKINVLK